MATQKVISKPHLVAHLAVYIVLVAAGWAILPPATSWWARIIVIVLTCWVVDDAIPFVHDVEGYADVDDE